jgi:periplasmic divalent cation tolerance protein
MPDYRLLLSTAGTREEAQLIARALVERRLAACANIVGPIESVYRWKGEVEESQEFLLLIKTTADLFPKIQGAIRKLHSYEVPELIQLPIETGLPSYLKWISENIED